MRIEARAAGGARAERDRREHIIVCNGYKDEEFMRLALMGQKLGHQVFIVIEQLSEVDVLLAGGRGAGRARRRPACASSSRREGAGRWAQSGGEKSKFGLNAAQLMKLIDRLRAAGRLDILKLIHFHLGTQITDIRFIKIGAAGGRALLRRAAAARASTSRTWTSAAASASTTTARRRRRNASVNYSLQEYANDVVYTIAEACREHEMPMPHIISESGRALTAHHALLLLKVIDVESQARAAAARAHRATITSCCTR